MEFSFDLIEKQIIEALPELQSAADVYHELEGEPGEDCGAYIFFESMVGAYVEALLDMPNSVGRDRLLKRVFNLVDDMMESKDHDVRDLAYIGLLEWRGLWYYSRALHFLGPVACRELDQWEPQWHEAFNLNAQIEPDMEIIDLYCAREVILRELKSEGIDRYHVPGNTYPQKNQGFSSLEIARNNEDAVAFLSCYGTTIPYIVCPAKSVACSETSLRKMAQDLANYRLPGLYSDA
jgi:hypothetical protein